MKKFRIPVLLGLAVALATSSTVAEQSSRDDSSPLRVPPHSSHPCPLRQSLRCLNQR